MPDRKAIAAGSLPDRKPQNTNRSAMTNDPLAGRASARTPRGRRIRDLFRGFLARLGTDADVITQSHCLRVAELIAIAEELRTRATGEELRPDLINAITRIESTAARAERTLLKGAPDAADAAAKAELDQILADYRDPNDARGFNR